MDATTDQLTGELPDECGTFILEVIGTMYKAKSLVAALLAIVGFSAATASASNIYNVYITEWMYKPAATSPNASGYGEYVEITNVGSSAVDLTGWSFDDSHEQPNVFSIGSIGTLQPGESAIITDDTADNFRSVWNLPASVPIVGGHDSDNLGNGDEANIYDASGTLVDQLAYGTSPSTVGVSANIPYALLGTVGKDDGNNASLAVLSSVGDAYGSVTSSEGNIGNPGSYKPAAAPEPASLGLLAVGGLALIARRCK